MRERVACYFLLGKMGALYSAGLHQYAAEINKLKGTDIMGVLDYGYWHPFTGATNYHSGKVIAKARTHRIALFGHSMGSTGISMIARDCAAAGVVVELVFSLDCSRFSMPIPLGSNVKRTVTYCDPSHLIGGVQMRKGDGYQGEWVARRFSGISHVAFDDYKPFRDDAVREVKALLDRALSPTPLPA